MPFLAEIRLFSYNSIPDGWLLCDGAALPVMQYQALFALIGNLYGGDSTNFWLPDLRGRTVAGAFGKSGTAPYGIGIKGGAEAVALGLSDMPSHSHAFRVSTSPGTTSGANNIIYAAVTSPSAANLYGVPSSPQVTIDASSIRTSGAGAPHDNMQPYLPLVYCIAVEGLYPPPPPPPPPHPQAG